MRPLWILQYANGYTFRTNHISATDEYCFKWTGRAKALIYLDDTVIWGAMLQEHNERLVEVFDCLRVQSLKLEPYKYGFLKIEVYFWGYKVTADGREKDSSYIKLTTAD